ncbi:MAG: MATE family efflux transporter [Chloroflexi bacterium]|nr:MATE family efflux transporter [Chloroflexota bacterium]
MTLHSLTGRLGALRQTVTITQGRLRDNLWQLSWPLMISQGLSFFPGLYDAYWLGRLGPQALAAAGLAMSVRITMISVLMALSAASGAVIARYVGARDHESANLAAAQAIVLFVVSAGSLSIIGLIFIGPLLNLAGASGALMAPTIAYARVIFAGLIAMEMVPSMGFMLSAAGSPQLSLQMNLWVLGLFVTLEPLLIGLGWGVTGAALATVAANTVGMFYGLYLLTTGRAGVRIELRHLRPQWSMMKRILRIALPGVIQRGMPNLANSILMRFMAAYGAAPLAAYGLFSRLAMLLLIPCSGLSSAAVPMVGQNLGAGQPTRAARAVKLIAVAALVMAGILLGLLAVFAEPAFGLFTRDSETIRVGVSAIGVLALWRGLMQLGIIMDAGLTGAGDTLSPMVINIIVLWLAQLPAVWLFSSRLGWGAYGIWWGLVIGAAGQALLLTLRFRQGRWQLVRI